MSSELSRKSLKFSEQAPQLFVVPVWFRVAFPVVMLIVAAACLSIDIQVARFFRAEQTPSFIREMVQNTEPFGHGVGVVVILLVAARLDRKRWKSYLLTGAISLGAGLCANLFKLTIGRARPRDLDIASIDVLQSFHGWFPYLNGIEASQSFPSGHTTVAFAFAVCLSALYPQGKGIFFFLAAFVAFGRVQCGAHFPSDVFAGAALGWTVSILALQKTTFSNLAVRFPQAEGEHARSVPVSKVA